MKGNKPGELAHHTTVACGDKMYLYGGTRPNGQTNKELYKFDT